jgi:lytic transglycosylase catalytic
MVIDYNALLQQCTNGVHPQIMHGIIKQESSFNPYAVGVVNGRLSRQPTTKAEAVAVVKTLRSKGMNYSMGLAQVNKQHMSRFGFTAENIFEPCANVKAGAQIFNQCHIAAKQRFGNTAHAIGAALSCYYSGNFTTGFKRYGNDKAPYVESIRAQMLTYANRPRQIGTPQLQRAVMRITVQTQPKLQTVALTTGNEAVAVQPEVVREKSFLIGGQTQTVSNQQSTKINSTLLF